MCAAFLLLFTAAPPRVQAGSPYSMELVWTATGDDADAGRAYGYDLRYSTSSVSADTVAWWNNARIALGLPPPSPSGQEDSAIVTGLSPETTYSFVLRCFDEAGNQSGFSNVVVATTESEIPPPTPGCSVPSSVPSQFQAREDSGAVLLTWAPTTDPLATTLHLWRASGSSGALTLLASVNDPSRTEYRDVGSRAGKSYRYRATWSSSCGNGPATASESLTLSGSSTEPPLRDASKIHAYPNPSHDTVRFVIHVEGASDQWVQIRLFDPSGHVVADIADASFPSGDTVISWPRVTRLGDRVAPGYYESIGTVGPYSVRERLILLP